MGWEVGGRFRREETYTYIWLIHINVWQEPTGYYKAIILQLNINKLKNKNLNGIYGHLLRTCCVPCTVLIMGTIKKNAKLLVPNKIIIGIKYYLNYIENIPTK